MLPEPLSGLAFWAGLSVALALALIVVERLRSDEDPSLRYSISSATGSASVLLSGVHVTAMLAAGVALLLAGAGRWSNLLVLPLGLVVVAHWYLEKREVEMN